MIHKLADIALAEVGVLEVGGNNCGKRIREYQLATDLRPLGPWAWCAAFVCWAMEQWLDDAESRAWLRLKRSTPEDWRPTTAAAYGLTTWAKTRPNTTRVLTENDKAMPGDLVTYDFSHCGILIEDRGGSIVVVEGNTNGKGERDSLSGDGVWRKVRSRQLVRNFVRIRPSGT